MVEIGIKMEEKNVIEVDVKNSVPIDVNLSTPALIQTQMYGTGPRGKPGQGMTPGGTVGQVLRKKSNTDHDNEWTDFDYEGLDNKPSIEGVPLIGDTSFPSLNLNALSNIELENLLTI